MKDDYRSGLMPDRNEKEHPVLMVLGMIAALAFICVIKWHYYGYATLLVYPIMVAVCGGAFLISRRARASMNRDRPDNER